MESLKRLSSCPFVLSISSANSVLVNAITVGILKIFASLVKKGVLTSSKVPPFVSTITDTICSQCKQNGWKRISDVARSHALLDSKAITKIINGIAKTIIEY